jgi:hypothetical protein
MTINPDPVVDFWHGLFLNARMGIKRTTYGLAILSLITACSNAHLPMGRDGAVPMTLTSDATFVSLDAQIVNADTIPAIPDSATAVPEVTILTPMDTAQSASDGSSIAQNPDANRSFRIDPEHPAPTPDATCTQYGPADYFLLTFGAHTSTVEVLMVSGSIAATYHATMGPEANKLTYHLADFFTGGKITFEQDHGVEVAQVILYGSGVPVIRCLRGTLLPQP